MKSVIQSFYLFAIAIALLACGGGGTDDNGDDTTSGLAISRIVVDGALSLKIADTTAISFTLTREYNDGSSTSQEYQLVWSETERKINLQDENGNSISLLEDIAPIGESSTVQLKFKDSQSDKIIILEIDVDLNPYISDLVFGSAQLVFALGTEKNIVPEIQWTDDSISSDVSLIRCRSGDEQIFSVTEECKITANAVGKASLLVSSQWLTSELQFEVNVTDPFVTQLKLDYSSLTLAPNAIYKTRGELIYTDQSLSTAIAELIDCQSSDSEVVEVGLNCELMAKKIGEATISVKLLSPRPEEANIQAELLIAVEAEPVTVAQILYTDGDISLYPAAQQPVALQVKLSDGSTNSDTANLVSCHSSDNAIFEIQKPCVVTAKAPGTAQLTIDTYLGNANLSIPVEVLQPVVTRIETNQSQLNLVEQDAFQVLATLHYSNNTLLQVDQTKLSCSSSHPEVVRIDENCLLSAIADGQASISVKLKNPLPAEVNINTNIDVVVSPQGPVVTEISVDQLTLNLIEGQSSQLSFTVKYSDGSTTKNIQGLASCVADTAYFSVTPDCMVTALQAGQGDVSLVAESVPQTASLGNTSVEVLPLMIEQISISADQSTVYQGSILPLRVSVLLNDGSANSNANSLVVCSVKSGQGFAQVNESCQLSAIAEGDAVVTAMPKKSQQITPQVTDLQISVLPLGNLITDVSLQANTSNLQSGETLTLTVTGKDGAGVLSDISTLVQCYVEDQHLSDISIGQDCKVTGLLEGTYTIYPRLKDTSLGVANVNYNSIEITVSSLNLGAIDQGKDENALSLTVPAGTTDVMYVVNNANPGTKYKVKLESVPTSFPLPFYSILQTLSGPSYDYLSCYNATPFYSSSVACGIDMAQSDKLYILLKNLDGITFDATLTISKDDNILSYDGESFVSDLNSYQTLTLGNVFNGHVPANLAGNNVSRYRLDVSNIENDLTVAVTFEANDFDADGSVEISWDEAGQVGVHVQRCSVVTQLDKTLSCQISYVAGRENVFVTVYGNGNKNAGIGTNGPAAAEGESSYSVTIY